MTVSADLGAPASAPASRNPTPAGELAPSGTMQFMQQWMELQAAHLRVTERFLRLQEQMFLHGMPDVLPSAAPAWPGPPAAGGNGVAPAPLAHAENSANGELPPSSPQNGTWTSVPTNPQTAVPRRGVRPPIAVRAVPGPAVPGRVVPGESAGNGHSPRPARDSNGHAAGNGGGKPPAIVAAPTAPRGDRAAAPVAAAVPVAPLAPAAAVAAPAPVDSADLPTVEAFERDLIQAVSDRTGYPTSVLNLDMALESGLGIDSIKTIEIFNKLKKYHDLFRAENEDEEETLAAFTRLKTLRDIVELFGVRRSASLNGAAPAAPEAVPVPSSGPAVERFALAAVDAPSGPEKKNGSPDIRS